MKPNENSRFKWLVDNVLAPTILIPFVLAAFASPVLVAATIHWWWAGGNFDELIAVYTVTYLVVLIGLAFAAKP